jgi:hypothetical protein
MFSYFLLDNTDEEQNNKDKSVMNTRKNLAISKIWLNILKMM